MEKRHWVKYLQQQDYNQNEGEGEEEEEKKCDGFLVFGWPL